MKRLFSIMISIILLLSQTVSADNAENASDFMQEWRTSNYQGEYLQIKIEKDTLKITGKIAASKYNCVKIYLRGDWSKEDSFYYEELISAQPNVMFETAVSLNKLATGESIVFYSYKGVKKENGYKGTSWIKENENVSVCKGADGSCYIKASPVLEKNRMLFNTWRNPADYLSQNIPSAIIEKSNEITAGANSDYEKILKIHDWVADNIYYDLGAYFGESPAITTPEGVLESKHSICQGYANLTAALIKAQNIPCGVVSGYALGISTDGKWTDEIIKSDASNHAWNEAFVDGRWIIIDTTWDSNNEYSSGGFTDIVTENGQEIANTYDESPYRYGGIRGYRFFDSTQEYFAASHKLLSKSYSLSRNAPSEWAEDGLYEAMGKSLLPFDLQKNYKENISRQDFCYLVVNMIEQAERKDIFSYVSDKGLELNNPFTDTDNQNVTVANALGIVNGTSEIEFSPNDYITRQEAATMLYRCAQVLEIEKLPTTQNKFADKNEFANWAADGINFVSDTQIMNGIGNNIFAPNELYSREQAYITVLRLFDYTVSN